MTSAAEADIARLSRRLRDEPRSTVFVALADALRRGGRFGEGLQVLREGFRVHPDHAPARVVLGRIHLEMGNRPLAAEVLQDVVAGDPENLAAASLLARLFVEDGRMVEARPLIERLEMANHPDAALRAHLPPTGERVEAPSARGGDPFDHPRLADRFARAGYPERAVALWRRLASVDPDSSTAREALAAVARTPLAARSPPEDVTLDAAGPAPTAGPAPLLRYARHFWRAG
jgi:cytochrome c-type biogenesis protein CcmH/NrfG